MSTYPKFEINPPWPRENTYASNPITAQELIGFQETQERLEEAFAEYGALTGIESAGSYSLQEIHCDTISFKYYSSWSYGGEETLWESMPTQFILDRPAWQARFDAEQAEKAKAARKAAADKARAAKKKAAEKEAAEKEQLAELAAKHGFQLEPKPVALIDTRSNNILGEWAYRHDAEQLRDRLISADPSVEADLVIHGGESA